MLFSKYFRKYYLKYGIPLIIGIAVLISVNYIQLFIPERIGFIIDELKTDSPRTKLIYDSIYMIALIASGMLLGRFLWRIFMFGSARRIEYDIREVMFNHASKLPQQYYNNEKVGGMMTYFTNDLEAIRMSYAMGLLTIIDGLVLGGLTVRRMVKLDLMLTIYAGIPMIMLMFIFMVLMKRVQKRFKERQKSFENLNDFTTENFSGINVIKAYVREAKELILFRHKSDDLFNKHMASVRLMVFFQILISLVINLIILVIIVYGSYLVIRGGELGWTTGQLTQYISYFFTLIWPTMAISQFFNIHTQAKASAERVTEFLNQEIIVCDNEEVLLDDDNLSGSIKAKNLSFKYPDSDLLVLKDVTFEIEKGEMVGILGRTGSGKSSLVDLLLRTYNLENDQLFIDDKDIMRLPIKSVRNLIGYVPQDNFLFSETITDNIGFSSNKPDINEVIKAAKLADVYDNIIEFKDQFDTILGERGVTVSGGQKQRISIARALAKNPEILILDDSVSAVDTKTEEAIIKNLHQVRKGKTTIFIAHRISTVKKMDKIILLDDGRVVGIGNHKTLLKESPLYQSMVKRQELLNLVEGEGV